MISQPQVENPGFRAENTVTGQKLEGKGKFWCIMFLSFTAVHNVSSALMQRCSLKLSSWFEGGKCTETMVVINDISEKVNNGISKDETY